jgi:hypothetical protein
MEVIFHEGRLSSSLDFSDCLSSNSKPKTVRKGLFAHFMLFQPVSCYFPLLRSSFRNFCNCFEFRYSRPTTLRKQVLLFSSYFTTIPDGRADGRRAAGEINTKANSAQLSLDWG